ncbi:unnamed protein product, partial [Prorocentrum cordatum]
PPGVGPHQMCGAGTAQGARALPLARAGGEACWGGPRPRQDCRTCAARPPRLGHGGAQAFLEYWCWCQPLGLRLVAEAPSPSRRAARRSQRRGDRRCVHRRRAPGGGEKWRAFSEGSAVLRPAEQIQWDAQRHTSTIGGEGVRSKWNEERRRRRRRRTDRLSPSEAPSTWARTGRCHL